jgi:hypothetical protein
MRTHPLFSSTARRILLREFGEERHSDEMAFVICTVYGKVLVHLSALLGQEGGLALFRHSLRRTQAAFPFYAEVVTVQPQTTLNALAACLEKQSPVCILEGSIALLSTFFEFLATFIGERLTVQLLDEVWPDLGPFVDKEMRK